MKINERVLARQFLNNMLNEDSHFVPMHILNKPQQDVCQGCGLNPCDPEICPGHAHERLDDDTRVLDQHHHDHSSHTPLEVDASGAVTPESLYGHFDLDQDGRVTKSDYADHIQFHCAHPETLDHYHELRDQSHCNVPCKDTYDSCSQFFMADPESIHTALGPLMSMTSSNCPESALSGITDVLKCLKKAGLL